MSSKRWATHWREVKPEGHSSSQMVALREGKQESHPKAKPRDPDEKTVAPTASEPVANLGLIPEAIDRNAILSPCPAGSWLCTILTEPIVKTEFL